MYTEYTGQLVRIRPFRNSVELHCFAERQFAVLNEHFGDFRWRIDDALERYHHNLAAGLETCFAVEEPGSGQLCGWVNARPQRGLLNGSVGTEILADFRGRGLGREAKLLALCHMFESFPLESVWAVTTGTHRRSGSGLEAIGFRLVGNSPLSHFRNGNHDSRLHYQILREDWKKLPIRGIVKRGSRT